MKAKTIADLGELVAQWLEGKITYQPGYLDDKPADETTEVVESLVELNRAGFYTTQSQPGVPIKDGCGQRAWVEGFCSDRVATKISTGLLSTELVVIAAPPGATGDVLVCVTVDDGKPFTWGGGALAAGRIADSYDGEVSYEAILTLLESWQVCVFDPVWGRKEYLWEWFRKAVT